MADGSDTLPPDDDVPHAHQGARQVAGLAASGSLVFYVFVILGVGILVAIAIAAQLLGLI